MLVSVEGTVKIRPSSSVPLQLQIRDHTCFRSQVQGLAGGFRTGRHLGSYSSRPRPPPPPRACGQPGARDRDRRSTRQKTGERRAARWVTNGPYKHAGTAGPARFISHTNYRGPKFIGRRALVSSGETVFNTEKGAMQAGRARTPPAAPADALSYQASRTRSWAIRALFLRWLSSSVFQGVPTTEVILRQIL